MVQKDRMSPNEVKVSSILASIYALRMLGIFLILPIFSIYAAELPSQPSIFQIGLALGIYGLTQAIFQIPFGIVSDVIGRKKVIYFGLVLFIVGSLCAGLTNNIELIILGRAIQGAGAISAVLSALLADLTSDESRTKAMGIVGVSIGLTFALSLVLSPLINKLIGVSGIFILMGVLSIIAILVIKFFITEDSDKKKTSYDFSDFLFILKRWDLNRLNLRYICFTRNSDCLIYYNSLLLNHKRWLATRRALEHLPPHIIFIICFYGTYDYFFTKVEAIQTNIFILNHSFIFVSIFIHLLFS